MSPDALGEIARNLIDANGGTARFAARLGYSRQRIHAWRSSGIPAREVGAVHRLTGAAPHALRPDLWQPPHSAADADIVCAQRSLASRNDDVSACEITMRGTAA